MKAGQENRIFVLLFFGSEIYFFCKIKISSMVQKTEITQHYQKMNIYLHIYFYIFLSIFLPMDIQTLKVVEI